MTDPGTTGGGELGDLPGLEGRSTRELVEGWTDDDWAEWFRDEVMSTPSWEKLASQLGSEAPYWVLDGPYFSRQSAETKLKFFEGWYRAQENLKTDGPTVEPAVHAAASAGLLEPTWGESPSTFSLRYTGTSDAQTDHPATGGPAQEEATTKEPEYIDVSGSYIGDEDSIVPELVGPPTPDPFGLPPKEPPTEPQARSPRISPTVMVIGIAVAIALILGVFLTLGGGDDTPASTDEAPAVQPAEPEGAEQAGEAEGAEGIEFETSFGPASYFGPTSFAAGETIEVTIEYRDANGDPITGATLYFSLIGSDDEAHFETVTDENGLAVFKGSGPAKAGTYQVLASDGSEVWEITVAEVT